MAIPTYDRFIEPLLRFLETQPDGAATRQAQDAAADALAVTPQERQLLLPSGTMAIYRNRVGWAHDRLKRAGLSSSPRRGIWKLTAQGREFVRAHPAPLTPDELRKLNFDFLDVRLRPVADDTVQSAVDAAADDHAEPSQSPDDRLEQALVQIRRAVADELLEALANVSPTFFESIVLDLLHRLGYGTSRSDLQRVGGAGDGGIDGVISLDKLGLEKVYVQAKRWQNVVGRPEVQAFYSALAGQRAHKGVFITTSRYTQQALDFAQSVEKIVLIDGAQLAMLMLDHDVGVSTRSLKVPKIDGDYFDEGST